MKTLKITILVVLLFSISTMLSAQNYFGWGFKTLNDGLNLPNNWTQESIVGDAEWYGLGGLYTPYEGSGNKYFCVWGDVGNDIGEEAIMITEAFDNTGTDNTFVGFWHHQVDFGGGNNKLEVYYRTSSTNDWVLMHAYNDAIETWTEDNLYFPEQSATMQVGFKGILVGGDNTQGVALDYVSLQYSTNTCLAPSNLTADNLTPTSVILSWTENGTTTEWNLEYGLHDFTQGNGTIITASTNATTTINDLSSNTYYDVYIQANCSSTQSDWVGPVSFYTECGVVENFPYSESFDNSNFDDDDWNESLHVNCWTEQEGHIDNPTTFSGLNSDWSPRELGVPQDYNPDNANSISSRLWNSVESWLISPNINIETLGATFEFDIALTDLNGDTKSLSGNDTIAVVISTDEGSTWSKSNILHLWSANENPDEITTTGIHQTVNLSAYSGNIRLAIYAAGNSMAYVYVDNIKMDVATKINDISENKISIYPNPTSDIINFDFKNQEASARPSCVSITDITGKIINNYQLTINNSKIDISNFPNGIYFIRIISENNIIIKKIIKK